MGICECGCGGETNLAVQNDKRLGYTKGEPYRFIRGHATRTKTIPLDQRYTITEAGCWEWDKPRDRLGYGTAFHPLKKTYTKAHIVVYETLRGPVPLGLELDHLCRNRPCVNPDHLEPVTHLVNMRRAPQVASGLCKRGHEFTPENTYLYGGARFCRACRKLRAAHVR